MQLLQKLKTQLVMIAIPILINFIIKGMSEVAFKIAKGYNPPKPLIKNVEKPDLNKKYT